MNTSSEIKPTASSSKFSQLNEQISAGLSTADSMATTAILNLGQIHQARLTQLSRTAASLKAQYGASDQRVIAAEASVSAATDTVTHLTMVKQQLAAPAISVNAQGWALQGWVYNSQSQAVANLTVFLVDSEKTYQQQYGFAYTDSNGYFLINYAGDCADQPAQLYIEIVNQSENPIYLSTTAFQPLLGGTSTQSITLPAGEPVLGDPPPAIRAVAFPVKVKKAKPRNE